MKLLEYCAIFGAKREDKKMAWKDTQIEVKKVDIANDIIEIQIGPEGHSFAYSQLLQMAEGDGAVETMKRNLAIRLALSAVDLQNPISVKSVIESAKFKYQG